MNKLSRQDVFYKVWSHFVVEGRPYGAFHSPITKDVYPVSLDTSTGYKSPLVLIRNLAVHPHVTLRFLNDLDSTYYKSFNFVFDGVNTKRIKTPHARRFHRSFRRIMKFFLIHFAMKYNLTVASDIPNTVHAKKAARKFKK